MAGTNLLETALPVLFNTEMVRAILEGKKDTTRRIIKPQPSGSINYHAATAEWFYTNGRVVETECIPQYRAGAILYVREACAKSGNTWYYKADYAERPKEVARWRPSIHMPREAARIFLRVTSVSAERLRNIDTYGIAHEGVNLFAVKETYERFAELWNSTVKSVDLPLYGWKANPWVWVYEFERVEQK